MSVSTTLGNGWLDTLRNVSYAVATPYCSLHQSDPGTTGASEVTGGSYARQAITFSAAAASAMTTSAALTFTSMPDTTGDDISHVGIWTAVSAGTFLIGGALTAAKVTNSGDTFEIAAGDLDLSIT